MKLSSVRYSILCIMPRKPALFQRRITFSDSLGGALKDLGVYKILALLSELLFFGGLKIQKRTTRGSR
jgi:hypothetical protein